MVHMKRIQLSSIVLSLIFVGLGCVSGQPDYDAVPEDDQNPANADASDMEDTLPPDKVDASEDKEDPPDAVSPPDAPPMNCDQVFYTDSDGDGHGDPDAPTTTGCEVPPGFAASNDDCDDTNPDTYTGATEIVADGIDQDCDGTELCYVDADDDGALPDDPQTAPIMGLRCNIVGHGGADTPRGDCDDNNPLVSPTVLENCDGIDQDCNGLVDDNADCPCPVAAYGEHTYLICNSNVNWPDAKEACEQRGYHLVKVDDAAENDWILSQAQQNGLNETWLGINDRDNERTFVWHDGSSDGYDGWNNNQPSNGNGQDCGEIHTRDDWAGTWNDESCGDRQDFICETP